ncbi:MAG: hypothetical protein KF775_03620 [Cyclobacteriaceae bacterium]|nr:hypothetical protein [Cytophagales bacterium]MBX2898709.1 hypothetical protein [Cyclobacteriaceae bacterium]
MAKTTKPAAEKKAPKKTATKAGASLDKIAENILDKLRGINIEHQLQADLEWCLGSYRFDGNPVGLVEAINRALVVLKAENAKKTKGITAALIAGIEKAIK